MSDTTAVEVRGDVFSGNLAALREYGSSLIPLLEKVPLNKSLRACAARDGSTTYAWEGDQGGRCWLGRTTMPGVRATALVEAFQPGTRNVLLQGMAPGHEAALLLRRLAPYQAVMVVSESPDEVALSLRLHDYSDDLRRGRLLIFAGPDAWRQLESFLFVHDGFLTPERVLSWPWFTPVDIEHISRTLSELASRVAQHRAGRLAALRATAWEVGPAESRASIVVLSNLPDPAVWRTAAQLELAAEAEGLPFRAFVLDRPAHVHPLAVEGGIRAGRPTVVVLLDVLPDELPVALPVGAVFVLLTHSRRLSPDWLERLPDSALLGVRTAAQRDQAIACGLAPSRVCLMPLAASAVLASASRRDKGERIAVVAEGHDSSAAAVGLHLASHCRLWDEATTIIQERFETYDEEDAEVVLGTAERRIRIKIENGSVRQGLITRIRQVLIPVLVRRAYCLLLVKAGVDFDLYGRWPNDPELVKYDRGPWPGPREVGRTVATYGMIISIDLADEPHQAVLDGLASGCTVLVRKLDRVAMQAPADSGESSRLVAGTHFDGFDTCRSLLRHIQSFQSSPGAGFGEFSSGSALVRDKHMWSHRLREIIVSCSGRRGARPE